MVGIERVHREKAHMKIAMEGRENISYGNYSISRNERERELWEGGRKREKE